MVKMSEDFESTKRARHEARLSMATYLEEVEKGLTTALGVSRFFLNDPETSQVNHLLNQITTLKEMLRGHLRRAP